MGLTAHSGEVAFEGLDVGITFGSDGSMLLKFALSEAEQARLEGLSSGIYTQSVVRYYYGTTLAFVGLVGTMPYQADGGVYSVTVEDTKKTMMQWPLLARSSAGICGTARHAKVRLVKGSTVGAMIKGLIVDSIETGDSMPSLCDILPAAITDEWDSTNLGAAWDGLDRLAYSHEFSETSVGQAITSLLGKYYPGRQWWVDPGTLVPTPYATYSEAAEEVDSTDRTVKAFLNGVAPALEACFTRVIFEGSDVSEASSDGIDNGDVVPGFVSPDYPFRGADVITFSSYLDVVSGNWYVVEHHVNQTRIGSDDQKMASEEVTTYHFYGPTQPVNLPEPVTNYHGKYGLDARHQYDSGYGGTAHSAFGIHRVLVVCEDTLGPSVWDGSALVDREAEMDGIGNDVWVALRDTRYSGTLVAVLGPVLNPARRVTVLNDGKWGSLTFAPAGCEWSESTGERTYTLGGDQFNPIEELLLLAGLMWRDKLPARQRTGSTIPSDTIARTEPEYLT